MAHNLQLEIFRISLKKKNGRNTNLLNFENLFQEFDIDKNEAYNKFVEGFINYFDNEFKTNADGNKGICTTNTNRYDIKFNRNIINGELFGGTTDIEQAIYKRANARRRTGQLMNDDVATLPYFFKLWTPFNHNTGVLMVQSYSNHTITALIRTHLTKYIQSKGFSILITPYVPDTVKEEYKRRSNVFKVTYVKEHLSRDKRRLLNPLFTEFDNIKVKIEVSGFRKAVSEFWDDFSQEGRTIGGANLEDLDIREEDDYKVIAHYEDEEGHQSRTSIAKNLNILPTIFLPDALKEEGKTFYDFEKIIRHTNHIMRDIKREIRIE